MEAVHEVQKITEVTKDTIIGDVLKQYPDVAVIMLEYGLHCVGCHANVFDSIEAGCRIHGMEDDVIEKLIKDVNAFIGEQTKEETQQPTGPANVFVSDAAANKIKDLLSREKQEGFGLRVSVSPGGCSGFMYQMNFEERPGEEDKVLEEKGVKLFIDSESLELLRDAEIDYVDDLNDSGFKINNPNAKHHCGCGKSFG
ncbi:hypothetical protein COV18_07290 [Candidatus Woesearchaeota archaeon CG10_big_fil_rev_8_21_14_0_10_37_12]|nr:MAG: hypothetical protein COV18_07290 [Candidatus Woesearchaeota archaeon CG10_big_fil_rev_8_21_14_0_10_37_12]